ncbi:MAG TPA: DUF4230 domain-containing protein [Polyangiaceae bacterium]|nr:DUF4230 domain-containing protein [Polyangiaceae bacterium]
MAYPEGDGERSRARAGWAKALTWWLALVSMGLAIYVAMKHFSPGAVAGPVVRPTATILMAVKDLARLETNELHLEKVIDLTDKQSRFFGLIDTADAILLIAAGDVTVGIDLTKLQSSDVEVDRATGTARLTLPPPEILSVRLDEQHTYVYRRTVGLLAERNDQLESKARQEALRAIEEAARHTDVMEKARRQAERQLQQLFEKFGVSRTTIGWRPA